MKILEYDEVDPLQVLELNMTCFGWMLTPEQIKTIRSVDLRCPEHFALYAVERGNVLSQVGAVIVDTRTEKGPDRIGFVWGVSTRPEAARRGCAGALIEESHRRLLSQDIKYSILGTGRSLVAHSLYEKMGYRDFLSTNLGLKLCGPARDAAPGIEFRPTNDSETILKLFNDYSKGLLGFVCRPKNFIAVRNAWSWMTVNTTGLFLENGRPIGFGLGNTMGEILRIKEVCCPRIDDVHRCVGAFEARFKPRHMTFEFTSRSSVVGEFARAGFSFIGKAWGVLMARDLSGNDNAEDIRNMYGVLEDRFQMTSIDEY